MGWKPCLAKTPERTGGPAGDLRAGPTESRPRPPELTGDPRPGLRGATTGVIRAAPAADRRWALTTSVSSAARSRGTLPRRIPRRPLDAMRRLPTTSAGLRPEKSSAAAHQTHEARASRHRRPCLGAPSSETASHEPTASHAPGRCDRPRHPDAKAAPGACLCRAAAACDGSGSRPGRSSAATHHTTKTSSDAPIALSGSVVFLSSFTRTGAICVTTKACSEFAPAPVAT